MAHLKTDIYRNVVSLECKDVIALPSDPNMMSKGCTMIYNVETLEGVKLREVDFTVNSISIDDPAIRSYNGFLVDFDSMTFKTNTICKIIELKKRRIYPRRLLECYREEKE